MASKIANRNEQVIHDGVSLNADEMKKRMKEAQDAMVSQTKQNEVAQAEWQSEMQITRDMNAKVKEDFEILTERFQKHQTLNENLVRELKGDHELIGMKCKELEKFKEKHEEIFQEERNTSMKHIIKVN